MAFRTLAWGCLCASCISTSVCLAGPPAVESIDLKSDALTVTIGEMRAAADDVMLDARKDGRRRLKLRGHVRIVIGEIEAIAESADVSIAGDRADRPSLIRLAGHVEIKAENFRAAAQVVTVDAALTLWKLEGDAEKRATIQRSRDGTVDRIQAARIWYSANSDSIKLDAAPSSNDKD